MTHDMLDPLCRKARVFVFLLALLGSLAFQGTRGLYETTEGRYAECARQTFLRGELDVPWLNGKPHWTKPPLTYWAIGAGLELFGVNTWGARAYLIVSYLVAVAAVGGAGSALWQDRRAGAASALVFATSPFVLGASWSISTDMLLAACQAVALCCFLKARRGGGLAWVLGMWLALGLAFLAKGPPGLLVLAGIAVLACVERHAVTPRRLLQHGLGLVLFAAVALPWYIIENAKFPGLLHYWLVEEVVNRNLTDEFQRNPGLLSAFRVYGPVLLLGALPWYALILVHARRLPRPRGFNPLHWPCGREWTFLLASILIPLLLFTLSKSKLPLYLLPLFAPISLALGRTLLWLLAQGFCRLRSVAAVACVTVLLFVGIKAYAGRIENKKDMKQIKQMIDPILAAHPEADLFLNYRSGLNGLQFYLQRELPDTEDNDMAGLLRTQAARGRGTLVLMREHKRKDRVLKPMFADGSLGIVAETREWMLVLNDPAQ